MDGLEFLREHPELNTKSIRGSRFHKVPDDLCGSISEFFKVDDDWKVVRHAPCFYPEQRFGSFVRCTDDYRFLARFVSGQADFKNKKKDIL